MGFGIIAIVAIFATAVAVMTALCVAGIGRPTTEQGLRETILASSQSQIDFINLTRPLNTPPLTEDDLNAARNREHVRWLAKQQARQQLAAN